MNVYNHILDVIKGEIEFLAADGKLPVGLDAARVSVEPPRDAALGDLSTNGAMVLAKPAGLKPRDLGALLADRLGAHPEIAAAAVAGPGFVNLRLEAAFWRGRVKEILETGPSYGDSAIGAGRKVNLEYVSANPTGPMHVGHGRGAVVGDALANLLQKAGFEVCREYYVNNAGEQMRALAQSVYFRYREALKVEPNPVPEGFYPGEYLVPVGEALVHKVGEDLLNMPEAPENDPKSGWREKCANFAWVEMMKLIKADLAVLGIEFDEYTYERDLHREGRVDEVVEELRGRDLVYDGTLDPPKGKPPPDDWEPREQQLFRATKYGDDTDRPLKKSDGDWTYFASDIAYHYDKYRRGFAEMIDVWGTDHKGYVSRMQAAVRAVTEDHGALDVRLCNLVNLLSGGEPVKMSKRAGTFVTLREVVDEVGPDVVRFIMLTRNNEAALDFDLVKVTEQSRDNPVFYVQYAHARVCSVLRNVAEAFPHMALDDASLAEADLARLEDAGELAMIKLLAGWPRMVESAAQAKEPHRIAFFLTEFAASFHGFWTRGNENETLRFIVQSDEALTRARIALARAAAIVIASGLAVMGVTPVEEMR